MAAILKMAATAATGRVRVASISEMTCIGIMYVCTKYGDFTMMCMIFSISARLSIEHASEPEQQSQSIEKRLDYPFQTLA